MDSVIVFAGDEPASTLSSAVARGDLVRLARGVYTSDTTRDPEVVVRSNWAKIVGRILPEAVITDRSARSGAPVDGVLYLAHNARVRDLDLPGLKVRARAGAEPQPGDVPFPGGLYFASAERGLVENCLPSRARKGDRRTMDAAELGEWVDYLCGIYGEERLLRLRRQAEEIAPTLGVAPDKLATLQAAMGVALGTRDAEETSSHALRLRRSGTPVDQARVDLFQEVTSALRRAAPQSRLAPGAPGEVGRGRYLPFYEAYFSNFIEGTEFTIDEAQEIAFEGKVFEDRPEDSHDILGTYRLVADNAEMTRTGRDADEFISLVTTRHASIMEGRPDKRPGLFKRRDNRAGETHFVSHLQTEGTLRAGFALRDQLDTAWERAMFVAFVIAEVHPFDDGNGRLARVMMNAELSASGECRIIVPTVFRQDYLDGLRRLTRQRDPSVFIKAMRFAHDFTASIDFTDDDTARRMLTAANAFNDPDSLDRLRIPERARPWDAAGSR